MDGLADLIRYKDVLLHATVDLSQACSQLCDAIRAKGAEPPAEAILLIDIARRSLQDEASRVTP